MSDRPAEDSEQSGTLDGPGAALAVDFRRTVPNWVRDVIDTHLAIEADDAKP